MHLIFDLLSAIICGIQFFKNISIFIFLINIIIIFLTILSDNIYGENNYLLLVIAPQNIINLFMCILGRGGQSALRFARLRMEKRHNYVRKVAEVATQLFITNDKPNIAGLILAGSADFKTELSQSDMFDPVSHCHFTNCIKTIKELLGANHNYWLALL